MNPAVGAARDLTDSSYRWQFRQRRSWAVFRSMDERPEPAVTGLRWQERQPGAGLLPPAKAFPCSEERKCWLVSEWQSPQACGWRAGAKRKPASRTGLISWVPWHSAQATCGSCLPRTARAISGWNGCAAPAPSWQEAQSTLRRRGLCGKSDVFARSEWQSTQATPAWPWTEESTFCWTTKTELPLERLASLSEWQVRQSSLPGALTGLAAFRTDPNANRAVAITTGTSFIETLPSKRRRGGARPSCETADPPPPSSPQAAFARRRARGTRSYFLSPG